MQPMHMKGVDYCYSYKTDTDRQPRIEKDWKITDFGSFRTLNMCVEPA